MKIYYRLPSYPDPIMGTVKQKENTSVFVGL